MFNQVALIPLCFGRASPAVTQLFSQQNGNSLSQVHSGHVGFGNVDCFALSVKMGMSFSFTTKYHLWTSRLVLWIHYSDFFPVPFFTADAGHYLVVFFLSIHPVNSSGITLIVEQSGINIYQICGPLILCPIIYLCCIFLIVIQIYILPLQLKLCLRWLPSKKTSQKY